MIKILDTKIVKIMNLVSTNHVKSKETKSLLVFQFYYPEATRHHLHSRSERMNEITTNLSFTSCRNECCNTSWYAVDYTADQRGNG